MFYFRFYGYNYCSDFYFPMRCNRRGQRLAHSKIKPFWVSKIYKVFNILTFEVLGRPYKSFSSTFLVRKRCIGEFKENAQNQSTCT